jgi:hypothetical protein
MKEILKIVGKAGIGIFAFAMGGKAPRYRY